MNEQDKQLLLKVLCAMLPHGIHLYVEHDWFEDEVPPYTCKAMAESHDIITNFANNPITCSLSIKPYLRSMSSMTAEEWKEFRDIIKDGDCELNDDGVSEFITLWMEGCPINEIFNAVDWLNAHHFDYRGMIEKGLALPAKEGMYND